MFSMQSDLGLVWKFKNIEVFQEFYVKNILVKLQHNAGKFWGVIKFTRDVENTTIKLQLDNAIYEELSGSQGPPRCCALESFKKCHTKVKVKLGWNSDE